MRKNYKWDFFDTLYSVVDLRLNKLSVANWHANIQQRVSEKLWKYRILNGPHITLSDRFIAAEQYKTYVPKSAITYERRWLMNVRSRPTEHVWCMREWRSNRSLRGLKGFWIIHGACVKPVQSCWPIYLFNSWLEFSNESLFFACIILAASLE